MLAPGVMTPVLLDSAVCPTPASPLYAVASPTVGPCSPWIVAMRPVRPCAAPGLIPTSPSVRNAGVLTSPSANDCSWAGVLREVRRSVSLAPPIADREEAVVLGRLRVERQPIRRVYC
jgi:hypothetical protein